MEGVRGDGSVGWGLDKIQEFRRPLLGVGAWAGLGWCTRGQSSTGSRKHLWRMTTVQRKTQTREAAVCVCCRRPASRGYFTYKWHDPNNPAQWSIYSSPRAGDCGHVTRAWGAWPLCLAGNGELLRAFPSGRTWSHWDLKTDPCQLEVERLGCDHCTRNQSIYFHWDTFFSHFLLQNF